MSTANHAGTPRVPTVEVVGATVWLRRHLGLIDSVTLFGYEDHPPQAKVDAAEMRGALADAYRAGVAEGRRLAALEGGASA